MGYNFREDPYPFWGVDFLTSRIGQRSLMCDSCYSDLFEYIEYLEDLDYEF